MNHTATTPPFGASRSVSLHAYTPAEMRPSIVQCSHDEILQGIEDGLGSIISLQTDGETHRLAVHEIFDQGGQAVVYVGVYLNTFERYQPDVAASCVISRGKTFSFLNLAARQGTEPRHAYDNLSRTYKRAFRVPKGRDRGDFIQNMEDNVEHENVLHITHLIEDPDTYERCAQILEAADANLREFLTPNQKRRLLADSNYHAYVEMVRQLFMGLAAVHAEGCFSADISQSNVFVFKPEQPSDKLTFKIGDFFPNEKTHYTKIHHWGWAGANDPRIMAPEEFGIILDRTADMQKADVYRMCAELYKILMGRPPVLDSFLDTTVVTQLRAKIENILHQMRKPFIERRENPAREEECEIEIGRLYQETRGVSQELLDAKKEYYDLVICHNKYLNNKLTKKGIPVEYRYLLIRLFQMGLFPDYKERASSADILQLLRQGMGSNAKAGAAPPWERSETEETDLSLEPLADSLTVPFVVPSAKPLARPTAVVSEDLHTVLFDEDRPPQPSPAQQRHASLQTTKPLHEVLAEQVRQQHTSASVKAPDRAAQPSNKEATQEKPAKAKKGSVWKKLFVVLLLLSGVTALAYYTVPPEYWDVAVLKEKLPFFDQEEATPPSQLVAEGSEITTRQSGTPARESVTPTPQDGLRTAGPSPAPRRTNHEQQAELATPTSPPVQPAREIEKRSVTGHPTTEDTQTSADPVAGGRDEAVDDVPDTDTNLPEAQPSTEPEQTTRAVAAPVRDLLNHAAFSALRTQLDAFKDQDVLMYGNQGDFLNPSNCYIFVVDPRSKRVEAVLGPGSGARTNLLTNEVVRDFRDAFPGKNTIWVEVYP